MQYTRAKLAQRGLDGKYAEISTFSSLNMKWSNYPHDKPVIFLDGLSPKMEAFCDIVSFVDPACSFNRSTTGLATEWDGR